jgi:acyl-CoA thioesterase-1
MYIKTGNNLRLLLLFTVLAITPLWSLANTILVLGDSISAAYGIPREAGWVNLFKQRLDEHYPDKYRVVNASVSGDTTAGGLQRLPELLREHNPEQVIVELGGNDGLRGMSLKQMESNLEAIIRLSQNQGAEVLMLSVELPQSYGVFFNRRFQQVFDKIHSRLDVPRVPLGFGLLKDRNLLQNDGIHPTEEAQPIVVDAVWTALFPGHGSH